MRKKNDQQRQEQRHEHHRATVEKIHGKTFLLCSAKNMLISQHWLSIWINYCRFGRTTHHIC